jgi:hypothetical protein
MLPELASFSHPGLTIKLVNDLVGFWMHVKDTVDKAIMSAVAVAGRTGPDCFSNSSKSLREEI